MKHPNQAILALHAGGDLGRFQGWLTARHVGHCERCREEVARFDEMRQLLPELGELPEIQWNRLAAEIQANVRLGLEAGECVRESDPVRRQASPLGGWRGMVAFASVVVLVAASMILEHPAPGVVHAATPAVQFTNKGIQVEAGDGQMLSLMNSGAQKVTYTMDAQCSVGARYIDPETGLVTINTVYVQ